MNKDKKKKNHVKILSRGIIIIVACIAVVVALFSAFRIGVEFNSNEISVTWSAFNTSLAILEVYIVIFTLGIVILGFYGYKEIERKSIAVVKRVAKQDLKAARKKVATEGRNYLEQVAVEGQNYLEQVAVEGRNYLADLANVVTDKWIGYNDYEEDK